ncbi:MAG TPA: helicase-related protein, partial [Burkholderiales bacterium]|nr:helicase-related protein [Burkholderiales bacterium]
MKKATSVNNLSNHIFPSINKNKSMQALTNLIAFGSIARSEENTASLLPCRVHSIHRGLAGLWACLDINCSSLDEDEKGGPIGKLYSQPREHCECGSRVYELFTCRNCGTAYARAYTNNIENPVYLWSEGGLEIVASSGQIPSLSFVDILLENPKMLAICEEIEIDLISGRVNPRNPGLKMRTAFLKAIDPDDDNINREFKPCAICNSKAGYGKSSVQDHQTKGDQPFLALISKQIQTQPPNIKATHNESFAPLKGRKVLIFSDSRQMAARLAPNLQTLSMKDTLRPLLIFGFKKLLEQPSLNRYLTLEDCFLAIIVGSYYLNVRLRPELVQGENFDLEKTVFNHLNNHSLDDVSLLLLSRTKNIPKELFNATYDVLFDNYYGLESLGFASIKENSNLTNTFESLPDLPELNNYFSTKQDLLRLWLRCWITWGIYFSQMPNSWINNKITTHSGNFKLIEKILKNNKDALKEFKKNWVPNLIASFSRGTNNSYSLLAENLILEFSTQWNYCNVCKTVQRPYLNNSMCISCGNFTSEEIDVITDPVFIARKQYYRSSTLNALKNPPEIPFSLIAAEHTAQLNSPQNSQIFSIAEKYELLFQDVNISLDDHEHAIDVLSCTTTMEVGIDIGTLLGVALRNMPPTRANYQQRAGRAGRRGNALASVTSFASSDSHDDYFFKNPELLISGQVDDPTLVLDNYDIAVRHILAFLLQKYHRSKLSVDQISTNPNLFDVLGTARDFVDSTKLINKDNFFKWLEDNENSLKEELNSWIPKDISKLTRESLLENFINEAKHSINTALREFIEITEAQDININEDNQNTDESGNGIDASYELLDSQFNTSNLLERLLYKGVLPKYAFPADVASFYIFDMEKSNQYTHAYKYSPSQSLTVALSQWAPGKTLWIDNKKYISGAIYTPSRRDRSLKWNDRKLYFECNKCHYAKIINLEDGSKGEIKNCEACGGISTFG